MDIEIRNLDSCPYSSRNGSYGGAAGDKDGIILNDENWIVKYPKSNVGMSKISKLAKFSCGPLSEFIGSHIYEILGYDVIDNSWSQKRFFGCRLQRLLQGRSASSRNTHGQKRSYSRA